MTGRITTNAELFAVGAGLALISLAFILFGHGFLQFPVRSRRLAAAG